MKNPMLQTIRRQSRCRLLKHFANVTGAILLGAVLYLSLVAILGLGSM